MKTILLFVLLISGHVFAQKSDGFQIDALPQGGILLDKGWKWHAGDNPDFAKVDFDDTAWEGLDPTKTIPQLDQIDKNKPLWLRTKLTSQINQEVVLSIAQSGASEIFLNGNRVLSFGQIEGNNQSTIAYDPQNDAFILKLGQPKNTLAVRYHFQDKLRYNSVFNVNFPLFSASINNKVLKSDFGGHVWNGFNIGVPFILFIVHFIFFLSYPKNKANLWYSLSSFFGFVIAFLLFKLETTHSIESKNQLTYYAGGLGVLQNTLLYFTMYIFLKQKNLWLVVVFATGSILGVLLNNFDYFQSSVLFNYLLTTFYVSSVIYMGNQARKQGEKGGKFLIVSMVLYIIFWSLFIFSYNFGWGTLSSAILFHLAVLILPVIISALLGLDFRNTNNLLIKNLEKINILSAEKQQILSTQNETLEKQVAERTAELVHKNRDLEIESALERVRGRSMSMQKSDELVEVINVVAEQLLQLNFRLNTASFFLNNDESEEFTFWLAAIGESNPNKIVIPKLNNPVLNNIKEAQQKGLDFLADILTFEQKNEWFQHVFDHSGIDRITEERKNYILNAAGYSRSLVLMKEIGLFIVNYIPQPYSDAENAILIRFAKVFEQAYTRFLDLQKAEAQAREAKIEVALERVRSKSISMTKTDEIGEITFLLFSELRQLDLAFDRSVIITFDTDLKGIVYWLAGPEGLLLQNGFHIPLFNHSLNQALIDNYKNKTEKWVFALEGNNKKKWDDIAFVESDLQYLPDFIKESMINYGDVCFSLSSVGYGTLMIAGKEPVNDAQFELILKFSKVFDQTYTRFLDIQKAEAQAREAQIEAALEKIRSRSLGMHNSEELKDVIAVMLDKLKELEVLIGTVAIQLFEEKTKNAFLWLGSELNDKPITIYLPYDEQMFNEDTYLNDGWQARINGEGFVNKKYTFEQKNKYFNYVFANNDLSKVTQPVRDFILQAQGQTICLLIEKNSALFLDSWNDKVYSEDMLKVLKRAAVVFEQAYVRFLDLQKAEAQAREAQIEAALERVRSRSMAMYKSQDLVEVINVVAEQLLELNFRLDTASFFLNDEFEEFTFWLVAIGESNPDKIVIPKLNNPVLNNIREVQRKGLDFMADTLTFEEKNEWFQHVFDHSIMDRIPEERKKYLLNTMGYSRSLVLMEQIGLFIVNFIPKSYTDAENAILKRFAKVFEQSYTRFLDLQKAEAQAREAQIEVALEKIRSRSLGMHNSTEIKDVAGILFEKLKELDLEFDGGAAIHLFTESSKDAVIWVASPDLSEPSCINLPFDKNAFGDNPIINDVWHAKETGENIYNKFYTFEEKNRYFDYVFKHNDFTVTPAPVREFILQANSYTASFIAEKNSLLGANSWTHQQFSDDDIEVLRRIAKVFEQAYIRFLDLQKAEAQARESQVQLAMERVRAKTMAMQHSNQLREIVATILEQLQSLGFTYGACSIVIIDALSGDMIWWISGFEKDYPASYHIPYFDHPFYLEQLNNWKKGEKYAVMECSGDAKKSYDKVIFSKTEFVKIPAELQKIMQSFEKITFSNAHMQHGALSWSTEPLEEEHAKILQRFAGVFEQSYTRFLDLQKAETQAREAQIEVALERVRARAMSMQKSDELADAAQILYHEFGKLGINTFTCGYMFIDEAKQNQTAWVTLPDGTILPNFIDFPLMGDHVLGKRYASWKSKKPLHIHQVEGKENKTHHEFLAQHVPKNVAKDIFERIPESIIFYSANFSNGYLLILATDFFSPEVEQIIIRFTKVFELTYTRFLDLELAESQAREAQIEVALERVRSKTLAMQSSEELSIIIGLIYNEMGKLNVQLQRCFFMIFNPQNLGVTWWMASGESVDLGKGYFVEYSEHPPQLAYLKGWQERQETWRHHMQGEEKALWDAFLFHDTELMNLPPFIIDNMKSYKSIHLEASFNSFGCLTTGNEQPLSNEAFDLLIRFSKVFDLTYTRFNDITVAEAQTREAQIEAAFERIRASALAMQTSEEFLGVVKTLYVQLNTLGQQELEATTIQFYDLEKGFINSWHAQNIDKLAEGNISLGTTNIPFDACELTLEWLQAYKSSDEDYTIVAKGEKLKEWLQLLVRISPEIKDRLGNSMPEISNFHFSEFSEGALSMVSLKPFSEESKYLLKRAASAFDLAYKRYLDLQLKEEQSLKLAQEKQRLEATLKKLKATQTQLIQSEKLASLGELTAGIAHEIQNPLNFVNNFSEVSIELANELQEALRQKGIEANSEEGELVSDLIQNQEKIHHHGKRASSIVKGMLEHSRKNSGNKELTDINALADEYLKLSYHGLRAKDHTFNSDFKTDFDESLPKMEVIPQDFGRVLLNLINNAFYATKGVKNPLVEIKTGKVENAVIVSVKDNGKGMSKETKAKMFQPFFTTKPTGEGTGLGLSLAYDIVVKGHGGTIEVESEEGEGTSFIVKIPIS